MARRLTLALAALGLGPAGCTHPPTCSARGTTTDLSGVASYAIGSGAGDTMSLDVTVYDYIESCSYDAEKFPIQIGNCTLWASLQQGPEPPSRFFPGNPSAWAGIDSGQACDLPLLGGTARVVVDSGVLAFADSTTGLFLSGVVTGWVNGTGRTGKLQWQFQAEGW